MMFGAKCRCGCYLGSQEEHHGTRSFLPGAKDDPGRCNPDINDPQGLEADLRDFGITSDFRKVSSLTISVKIVSSKHPHEIPSLIKCTLYE